MYRSVWGKTKCGSEKQCKEVYAKELCQGKVDVKGGGGVLRTMCIMRVV